MVLVTGNSKILASLSPRKITRDEFIWLQTRGDDLGSKNIGASVVCHLPHM